MRGPVRRAFTLIELVVVLVLIGLLVAFSPLALDSLVAERELEKEASRYGTTIELLSREAVLHRTAHAIHIDTEKHSYAVQVPEEILQDSEEEDGEPKKILILDLDLDPGDLDWHPMPDGITIEYYEGSRRIERGRYRILINPTGTIDPHSLIFESNSVESLDERDRTRTVKVNFPGFVSFAVGKEIEEFKKSEAELR
ncbi:MAG: prepilin-type N-terminal cleavage/methylation domain-containing protein [Planctomycetota bacterium]